MFAGAFASPFLFLRRRPIFVLSCLFVTWALSFGVDVAVGPLSRVRFVNDLPTLDYAVRSLLYQVIKAGVLCWPTAVLGAQALLDAHGRNPQRRPSAADGARWGLLSLVYILLISTPLGVLVHVGAEALSARAPTMSSFVLSIIHNCVWLVLEAAVLLRFTLAWPHALATGNVGLFRSWSLSRNRYGAVLAALMPLELLTTVAHVATVHAFYAGLDWAFPDRFFSLSEVNWQWVTAGFIDAVNVIDAYLLNIAAIYVYQKLRPMSVSMAAQVFA